MSNPIIQCQDVHKFYHDGNAMVKVLQGINLEIKPQDRLAIVGPSGSGKSTLLHILGGLDQPSQGQVLIQQHSWQTISEKRRCEIRNQQIGFIYQFHHLLPEFSARENVVMPLAIANKNLKAALKEADAMLDLVGLSHRIHHKPPQLSGGERQRVAIARALIRKPKCIFADEPTGNLDQGTAAMVFDLMLSLNKHSDTALIIVTHDLQIAARMDQTLVLTDGRLHIA
jgi:lipoprotein-releasing system ATP-binding protein